MAPRVDPPLAGDERTLLVAFLDFQRATILQKAHGLDADGLALRTTASSLTLAGLLKHLTLVETSWFVDRFAGEGIGQPWAAVDWDADPDWEFRTALEDDPADLVAAYEAACAHSNAITAAAGLDQLSSGTAGGGRGQVSLRWILLHMIEETARHAGHADLLREAVDGTTGD